jgi:acyl-coenzyme A synthetase/AMP-(fatty) acid ligase
MTKPATGRGAQITSCLKEETNVDERPWFKSYDPGLPRTLQPYTERTLLGVMADTVRDRPGHTALLFKGARTSHGELDRFSNAFAAALTHPGVKNGDRVAFVLPNCPQAIVGQVAAYKVPRHIAFRDTLPKTRVGKVLRRELVGEQSAPATH